VFFPDKSANPDKPLCRSGFLLSWYGRNPDNCQGHSSESPQSITKPVARQKSARAADRLPRE
jgi:hypothetical protein